jgi:hypothetical protein
MSTRPSSSTLPACPSEQLIMQDKVIPDRQLDDSRLNTNNSGRPLPTFLKSCTWVPRSGLATMGTQGTLANLRQLRP